jgi:enoyl-CoA hydratase
VSAAATTDLGGDALLTEQQGSILLVTINRPSKRNAVNGAVAHGVAAALDLLDRSPELRVGVIQGAGPTFCAGMDLEAYATGEVVHHSLRGFAGIVQQPPAKPLVAAVDGWALGGGFEIVLACDLVVAAPTARFGLPEVKRGLAARGGGVLRLAQRLPRAVAMELILTGTTIDGERAAELGLVNRLADSEDLLAEALALAGEVAANAPLAVRASKQVAIESADWRVDQSFDLQRRYLDPVFASRDAAEGVAAFRERRAPEWSGC